MIGPADAYEIARMLLVTRDSQSTPARILHYPCGDGRALMTLGVCLAPAITYGADPHLSKRAASLVNFPCSSSLESIRLGRGFHLALLDISPRLQTDPRTVVEKVYRALLSEGLALFAFSQPPSPDTLSAIARQFAILHPAAVRLPGGHTVILAKKDLPDQHGFRTLQAALQKPAPPANYMARLHIKHVQKPPAFSPAWMSDEECARVAETHGPWAKGTPPEYEDWDPTAAIAPVMPLRRGHLALLSVSGALGVIPVTLRGRRALILGSTARVPVVRKDGNASVSTDTIQPSLTILYCDNCPEIVVLEEDAEDGADSQEVGAQ